MLSGMNFIVQIFLSKKCQRSYRLKRNPRDIPWTVLYRRKHKKGVHGEENTQKKRTRRVIQIASRAVGNVSLEAILAKRNQKPEFRRAQREQAIKAAKDAARAAKSEKKAASKALKVGLQVFASFNTLMMIVSSHRCLNCMLKT
ncbi:unnamed protein product [Onchocerca flexuosa]|uniref:Large ribosomal subunit protein eL24 n=1 Tax=Onchocerca flexuosa TaxID=387005 RepID=A0A183HLT4_9BILA|nr:unnamed protein product [Onchocerca flexuosa]